MRRALALVTLCLVTIAGCGDGIDEGANEGKTNRGTIDGVTLDTVSLNDLPDDDTVPNDTRPDPGTTNPATTDPIENDTAISWVKVDDGIEEGFLEVPLDYDDPDGATIRLYLVRHLAVDPAARIGTLLVNPGGPGAAGSNLAYGAESVYGQDLLDRFDILGWDPRGVGFEDHYIDCIDAYDDTFGIDSSPDSDIELQAFTKTVEGFAADCEERSGAYLPYVSTMNSARDMDAIREALGEDTISYFGFSYGSELGATWATMFPDTVRATVLDGAVDPTVPYFEQNLQQAAGFEASLTAFLAQCSADANCAFHNDGNAEAAFDELALRIDENKYFARSQITQGFFFTAVLTAMYFESRWPALERALADAQDRGDWSGLQSLYDDYYELEDGFNYTDATEAYFAISCLDDPGTTSIDELMARENEFVEVAPRVGRHWLLELAICAVWPERPQERLTITGTGAGPILVVGTTGDPATPLASTRNMATALEDGHLVVVDAAQHLGYNVNRCVNDAVDAYLVDPTQPLDEELVCS